MAVFLGLNGRGALVYELFGSFSHGFGGVLVVAVAKVVDFFERLGEALTVAFLDAHSKAHDASSDKAKG